MALMKCPECGNEVSSFARACPKCGCPVEMFSVIEKGILVGRIIEFGNYPQTKEGDDKTPIKWRVLALNQKDLEALLISEYVIDCQAYDNIEYSGVKWEDCSLRRWLNDTFLNAAFSPEEQAKIVESGVDYFDGVDKVFLISTNEAESYFLSDEDRMCIPTEYTIARGALADPRYAPDGKRSCWWWLIQRGKGWFTAADINSNGSINEHGDLTHYPVIGVRPAMWIKLGE